MQEEEYAFIVCLMYESKLNLISEPHHVRFLTFQIKCRVETRDKVQDHDYLLWYQEKLPFVSKAKIVTKMVNLNIDLL